MAQLYNQLVTCLTREIQDSINGDDVRRVYCSELLDGLVHALTRGSDVQRQLITEVAAEVMRYLKQHQYIRSL